MLAVHFSHSMWNLTPNRNICENILCQVELLPTQNLTRLTGEWNGIEPHCRNIFIIIKLIHFEHSVEIASCFLFYSSAWTRWNENTKTNVQRQLFFYCCCCSLPMNFSNAFFRIGFSVFCTATSNIDTYWAVRGFTHMRIIKTPAYKLINSFFATIFFFGYRWMTQRLRYWILSAEYFRPTRNFATFIWL